MRGSTASSTNGVLTCFIRDPGMHGWGCAWSGQKLRGCAGAL
jgi:hypothetical protein